VTLNLALSIRLYICPSIQKSFFDFSDIWHVGRGPWVMHDGMQYDPIQGQGYEHLEVGNPVIFQYLSPPFTMGAGNRPLIHKLGHNM